MSNVILTETTRHVPFKRSELWPILSKTDWINRALGLPPVRYDIQPLTEGGSAVNARAKMFGLELRWKEIPFEWLENEFYCVHRLFETGPFREGRMGVEFKDGKEGSTLVRAFSEFIPRNVLGGWLVRNVFGPKTNRGMEQIIEHTKEYLQGRQPVPLPKLPKRSVSEQALQTGLKKLMGMGQHAELLTMLERWLRDSPDVDLGHIRPLGVARSWRRDPWEVLRLFLQATRCGLLDFRWEVLCPNCRSTRQPPTSSLGRVQRMSHCEVCQIKFDAEFDRSVELKFAVNSHVRPCDSQTFCLAGPGGKPHIYSQLLVAPGQSRAWKLPPLNRPCRLRSPQIQASAVLRPDEVPERGRQIVVRCDPQKFQISVEPNRGGEFPLRFVNPNAFTVQIIFEAIEWSDDVLTAAQVTNWQEFRDLFDTEVISPDEQITVGSQIVLFTDLRGSTAMYNGIGDAPAYVLVRNHFQVLTEAIRDHHGAIVKTIGDAVMAVFSRVEEALSAVKQMHEKLPPAVANPNLVSRLMLKSSLHIGPCLAVNANDKLDFFGTTINLAARMVGCCKGDDLTVSDELHQRPETDQFLVRHLLTAEPSEVKFRGFDHPHKVWRIPMVG